jgi:hypothetical protein
MMDKSKGKIVAAATAAVAAYLEQEAAAMQVSAAADAPAAAAAVPWSLWSISGRQSQMANGQLMQMRVFKK